MHPIMQHLKSKKKLNLHDFFSNLTDFERLDQAILQIDLEVLDKQINLLQSDPFQKMNIGRFDKAEKAGDAKRQEEGFKKMKQGLVGCLLIAGGQGTRLNHLDPKGTYPISAIKQKNLFQIFAEKVAAASLFFKQTLQLAIMTSPSNDLETRKHFIDHHYFGLKKEQIDFFVQAELPFIDFNKQLLFQDERQIAKGPSGNGSVFESFCNHPVKNKWKQLGIQYLNIVLIDNPLADPFDFEMIGALSSTQSDVVLKCCQRAHPEEKVGIIVEREELPYVIEYSEIPKDLLFEEEPLANLSLLATSLEFIEKIAKLSLPLHKAQKKCPYYDFKTQKIVIPTKPNAWKFETYLFDALPYAKKTTVLNYLREDIFAPLKAIEGENNPQSVREALIRKEKKIYQMISQCIAPEGPLELSAQFYYPTEELIQRWRQKQIFSSTYLE